MSPYLERAIGRANLLQLEEQEVEHVLHVLRLVEQQPCHLRLAVQVGGKVDQAVGHDTSRLLRFKKMDEKCKQVGFRPFPWK